MLSPFFHPRLRVPVLWVLLVLVVTLAACTGPTPSIVVATSGASAAVVRGGSVDVTVSLTRLGGAADPVTLDIAGLPANVGATFAPTVLSGATLESTLTIEADALAAEGTVTLTITGTMGTLSDEVDLSLEITSLSVTGRVEGVLGRPLSGLSVSSQGVSDFTDTNGEFTLDGLAVPYDLATSTAAVNGGLHVFEGMTSATPVVSPFFSILLLSPSSTTTIDGDLLGGAALAANEIVVVCLEGVDVIVIGCDRLDAGDTAYAVTATWQAPGDAAVRVHALYFTLGGDGTPAAYQGYDTFETVISGGGPTTQDLTFEPLAAHAMTATLVPAAGLTVTGTIGYARFGPNLAMPLFQAVGPATDVDVLMPDLPDVTYDLLAVASSAFGSSLAWLRGVGADAGTMTVSAPAELLAPTDGQTGVGLATTFSASTDGGPQTFYWVPTAAGPQFALTTMRSSVTLPDPALGGFAFPAGADYDWMVAGIGGTDVDDAAVRGITEYYELLAYLDSGGPGVASDGQFSLSDEPGFQFAP